MDKRLIVSGIAVLFGVAILATAGIMEVTVDLGADRVWDFSEVGSTVAIAALVAGIAYADRDLGSLEGWEIIGMAAIGALLAAEFADIQMITDLLNNHHPWSGVALATAAYGGFYALVFGGGGR